MDTIELLQECNAGIKMGIDAIDSVMSRVSDSEFKSKLVGYKDDYNSIQDEIDARLREHKVEPSNPSVTAKLFATVKTEVRLTINDTDATIADLLTDGCHMGIKSLNKGLNCAEKADNGAKEITKKLIRLMDRQEFDMRKYL